MYFVLINQSVNISFSRGRLEPEAKHARKKDENNHKRSDLESKNGEEEGKEQTDTGTDDYRHQM